MSAALAVDLGGTRVKLGVVDQDGRVLARKQLAARADEPFSAQLDLLARHIVGLMAGLASTNEVARGLVLGFPGVVDVAERQIVSTSDGKYEDAVGFDLVGWARREFGLDVVVENDARMALIGEWQHGAGRGVSDLVMVTLGTGLGTGVVAGGQVFRGAYGRGGILGGHVSVRYGGARCLCGNRGCAEAEASTDALSRVIADIPDCASSRLRGAEIDFRDVVGLARSGDSCAGQVIDHTIDVWTAFVVNLLHAYDPERVVVGGGIAEHQPTLMDALRLSVEAAIAKVRWTPAAPLDMVPCALGNNAALLAAHTLLDEFGGQR